MKGIAYYNEDFFSNYSDEELLRENMIRILLTSPGERVNNPLFGSRLKEFLFDFDVYLLEDIKFEIKRSVEKWEPRVSITNITITKNEEFKFFVLVEAIVNSTGNPISYETVINL